MIFSTERIRKAKKFLTETLNKNFWAFLFFLFLSAGFWLFLTLEDIYEVEIAVPVSLRNVPENVVLTTEPPRQIKIRVRDHGGILLRYRYGRTLGKISIDYNEYASNAGHVALPTAALASQIANKLQAGTTIVGYSPDTLEYFYNFGLHKTVPVRINGTISADSLYCITDIKTQPSAVKVYATQEVLDTIKAAYTTPLDLKNLSERTTVSVPLAPIRGAKTVPASVKTTVSVDQMTEKSLPVRIEHINFPAGKTLKTFPGIVNVVFQVGLRQYRDITADKFAIVVSYDELTDLRPSNRLRLNLKTQPDGISHVRIVPDEVEFLIEDDEY